MTDDVCIVEKVSHKKPHFSPKRGYAAALTRPVYQRNHQLYSWNFSRFCKLRKRGRGLKQNCFRHMDVPNCFGTNSKAHYLIRPHCEKWINKNNVIVLVITTATMTPESARLCAPQNLLQKIFRQKDTATLLPEQRTNQTTCAMQLLAAAKSKT